YSAYLYNQSDRHEFNEILSVELPQAHIGSGAISVDGAVYKSLRDNRKYDAVFWLGDWCFDGLSHNLILDYLQCQRASTDISKDQASIGKQI
ncbi:MAG: hypothetical protein JAY91_15495, partial [Candidatus Thiodiazotropha endolucinida]|nr:hypothetical protein [Candidatus Thiodiazotropha taylori]MCW4242293.1 hypothetical protein [Candidatus Thiodiazotropha taylori]